MLIVTQDEKGQFSCIAEGAIGMCVQGRGASVLEAVGSWAIYSSTVTVKCNPPALLQEFSIATDYEDLSFKGCPSRS